MGRRNNIDWEAIETDFRISQLSLRQIAEKHGTEASSISRKAKKDGWTRDLSAAVSAATKAKVRNAVIAETQRNATECTQEVFNEVDLAANVNATIIIGHQRHAGKLRNLLASLTDELVSASENTLAITEIAEAVKEDDPQAAVAVKKLRTLTARMNNLKTASETLDRLTKIERQAHGLDEEGKKGGTLEDVLAELRAEEGL